MTTAPDIHPVQPAWQTLLPGVGPRTAQAHIEIPPPVPDTVPLPPSPHPVPEPGPGESPDVPPEIPPGIGEPPLPGGPTPVREPPMPAPMQRAAGAAPSGAPTPSAYAALAARLRATLPGPLVFTNGVFDLLHAGHVACLEAARAHGASLVVGVNGDASAQRLGKGPGRPLHSAAERLRVVQALRCVSAAVVFDEDKPLALIAALRPEVYVKGGDYREDELAEAALVREWDGHTVIIPRVPGLSSTGIVHKLCPKRAAGSPAAR